MYVCMRYLERLLAFLLALYINSYVLEGNWGVWFGTQHLSAGPGAEHALLTWIPAERMCRSDRRLR